MTGQALYELHLKAMAERGCGGDSWEQLGEGMQADWNRTAELLWGGE